MHRREAEIGGSILKLSKSNRMLTFATCLGRACIGRRPNLEAQWMHGGWIGLDWLGSACIGLD